VNLLQKTFRAIAAQLGGLPTTAKLLIGSLMVILVMSLLMVAQIAGQPSMVPLPIDLDPEARTAAQGYLERTGIPYEDREGRLMVPAEQRFAVLAQLTDHEVITGDQIRFDSLIEQSSPFLTREQNRKRWLVAKMNVLSDLVSKFRGIQRATVVLDKPEGGGFGRTHQTPTASVTVIPAGDALTQDQVEAIAHLVAGAQPGLKAAAVRVIDAKNGRKHTPRSDDQLSSSEYLEIKQAAEQHVKATIVDALSYIAGVRIAVNAMVDTRRVEQRTDSYEDAKVGPLSSSRRTIDSSNQASGNEPGIQLNTGVAPPSTGGGGSKLTDESAEETTRPVFPRDAKHITDRKGYPLKINATIGVPRSYFVAKFRQDRNDPEAVPQDADLAPIVTAEIARLKSDVEPLIDTGALKDAVRGTVKVSMIPDVAGAVATFGADIPATVVGGSGGGGGGGGGGGWGGSLVSGDLIKFLGLVGLALLSLAMMFLMVKRAGVTTELPSAEDIVGVPPPLPTDESEVVGEAIESAPVLEGVEVDDAALRRQQMKGQISEMVKQNPDAVANLLRRWITVEA
jgi:flagellar biosynthesis/type III secretory pathway M-ring protein FliF/YscJ